MSPTNNPNSASQVVIRCRVDRRLSCLKTPSGSMKNPPSAKKGFDYPLISSFRSNLVTLVSKARLIEFLPRWGESEMNFPLVIMTFLQHTCEPQG